MSDEEVTVLEEELAEARSEVERLQSMAADREARAAHLEGQLAELRQELAGAQGEVSARNEELVALRERTQLLETDVAGAAQRYRELALQQEPDLPEELVAGATVAEVDAALDRARETVSKVRGHLESQALAGRVPVGAPPRSAPGHAAFSTEEKIELGLAKQGS